MSLGSKTLKEFATPSSAAMAVKDLEKRGRIWPVNREPINVT